jgi:hypothetical protein
MNPAYRPMLATLVNEPFDDKDWVFETKWDGFRLITEKRDQTVSLWSRNGIDVTTRYAVLLPALQKIKGSCVIDGELCALDAHGRSRFQLLQNALNEKAELLYVVFDALFAGGKDIRKKPLLARKEILNALLPRNPLLHYSEHVAGFGKREFAKAQRAHEEGVIAKRAGRSLFFGQANPRVAQVQSGARAGGRDSRLHRAAQVAQVLWLPGACGTRQSEEALGLCGACRHRIRPSFAEVYLRSDAASAHRQEAFRPKGEVRERDDLAYSQARGRGKIR